MVLSKLRKEIDSIDRELLMLLAKRMAIVKKIGKYKKENCLPVRQKQREEQLISEKKALAGKFGLNKDFVKKLYREIINESLKIEKKF